MNYKKLSKKEAEEEIKKILYKKLFPPKEEIKKLKRLAMSKNIKLKDLRKKFCKKCLTFFIPLNTEIRIKKQNKIPIKIVKCKNCGYVSRWKMKN